MSNLNLVFPIILLFTLLGLNSVYQNEAFALFHESIGPSDDNRPSALNQREYLIYENSVYGIKIKYPSEWSILTENEISGPVHLIVRLGPSGSDSAGGFEVGVLQFDLGLLSDRNIVDIDTFTEFYMSEILSGFPDFKPLELDKDTYFLSGNPAYKLTYTASHPPSVFPGGAAKTLEYGTIVGDKVFSVAYIGKPELYSDNLSLAQEMIDSFQIATAQ